MSDKKPDIAVEALGHALSQLEMAASSITSIHGSVKDRVDARIKLANSYIAFADVAARVRVNYS